MSLFQEEKEEEQGLGIERFWADDQLAGEQRGMDAKRGEVGE